jgi:hypothetical protein
MGALFINAGIAAGVGLAALPFILHLFFRQTPKRVVFPALRLVRERQKRSRKKLKVKNWLLLLARMGLLALMALALARPRLWSNTSLGDREVPTAIAMVFDTSLSMEYKERDRTRLDEAKERARAVLTRAHESSRVFVIDSSDPIAPVALSPTAARKRVDALAIVPANRPLNAAVGQAYKAVAGAEQPRHEVYIFTDLARTAWDSGRAADGLDAAKKDQTRIATYVVRLAPKVLRDAAVVEAEPAAGFAPQDAPVTIRAVVRSTGPATSRLVELHVDGVKRAQQTVSLPADGESVVRLTTPRLGPGLRRAEIRLAGEPDPLERDDHRYVTLDVQPAQRVLIVSDQAVDAEFVEFALDPVAYRAQGPRPFPVERVASTAFTDSFRKPLRDYAAIFVLNVRELPESDWGRLSQYVREGGGLVIAPGDRTLPEPLNDRAGSLLPAKLGELKTTRDVDFTFGKADVGHPLFERNTQDLLAQLARVPVARYRAATPLEGSRTLLSYTNNDPALLERVFPGPRAGRVLLWTTALSRRPGQTKAERDASWNEFPIVGWSFFALMNQTVPYLANLTGRRLDYEAGEDVTLPLEAGARYTSYVIEGPGAKPERLGEPISGAGLIISAPPLIGPWTIKASGQGIPERTLGFSVNVPRGETQLTPLNKTDLAGIFGGKKGFVLVDDPEKLVKDIVRTRVGTELFPILMALILLLVTAENILANTFYREGKTATSTPGQRAAA